MSFDKYQIVFEGLIITGFEPNDVKQKLSVLFKTDTAQIEKLFTGQRIIIKDDLEYQIAIKYCEVIKQQGADCEIKKKTNIHEQPVAVATDASKTEQNPLSPNVNTSQAETDTSQNEELNDEVESGHWHKGIVEYNTGSLSTTSLAPVGIQLVECEIIPDLDISLDHLSLAAAGDKLVEVEAIDEPDIPVGHINLIDSE